ncbi:MAG TPA: short-chain fatty acyl-CoA regulator family protein [Thermoanaerobaculia bacterium]|nr:short-chain fatty acyl-CoA regulator family protein [Thermoanaerobaculia bacterium]
MPEQLRLGTKVRGMRRREGLTQMQLAGKLDISPSYLNLIEHNQRPLPAHLLVKIAQVFEIDLSAFADDSQVRLSGDLQEVFGDALFEEHPLTTNDVRELADNPSAARAVIALYQAYRTSVESTRALAAKLYDGRDFLGLDPAHLPSEEVNDVIQASLNYFPELEAAAERVAAQAHLDRSDLFRSLTSYLREKHGIDVVLMPVNKDSGVVRRFDPDRRVLSLSEILPPWSRNFQLAHQIGMADAHDEIQHIIVRAQKNLTAPESVRLGRVALANYFAAALLMPYDEFLRCAEEMRYDVELLQHHFTASWEQVCHRMTTMRKPGAPGVSFHFVRVDIAGNISKRFSGTGIRFARFSGSCPRWDVHAAFLTPGRIRTQVSKMPDGTAYFCVARTIRKSRGFGSGDTLMAVGIGCSVGEARKLVYADGYDLSNLDAAIPIGTTCRLCERLDCEQRAFPALQWGMTIDENVRGRSFFAPVVAPAETVPATGDEPHGRPRKGRASSQSR